MFAHCMNNVMRREATESSGANAVQAAHKEDACNRRLTSSDVVSPSNNFASARLSIVE